MPKQVDHEERRQAIAAAVCRLASQRGLDGVSLRHVAAEAGVSMGLVQHYFTTKDEMLLFAFQVISGRVEKRIGTALPQPPTARSLLRVLLTAMVPHDATSRFEAPLWVAFLARAILEENLAAPLREGGRSLLDFVVGQLRSAQHAGDLGPGVDPELEAVGLLALTDGLMVQTLIDPDRADRAMATIDYHLDRIFAGSLTGDPAPYTTGDA
jgi:AcrR family transcriptional regulator